MIDKLSDNLNTLITTKKVSVSQLARATGVPASTIKKIRNRSNMNPTLATLIPIARFFSVSLDYLISDHEKYDLLEAVDPPLQQKNNESNREWPLISWEKAIYWPCTNESPLRKVLSTQSHNPQTFAIQVEMDDWGIFTKGTVLLVDPTITPSHRDYVIVYKATQTKAKIKMFLSDDENRYLKSVSIPEDVARLTPFYKIIGVVMEYWKQLKKSEKKHLQQNLNNKKRKVSYKLIPEL